MTQLHEFDMEQMLVSYCVCQTMDFIPKKLKNIEVFGFHSKNSISLRRINKIW